jgi:6,7-dimethyl-8-ribityllumazine synthase
MSKIKKKSWVRKEKIVTVGSCKYCHQEMTSEDSFIPIGKVIRGKYKYQNAHYDCVSNQEHKSVFDW